MLPGCDTVNAFPLGTSGVPTRLPAQGMAQTKAILSRPPALAGPWVSPSPPPMFLIPWSPAGYELLTPGQGEQGEACMELWVSPSGRRALCLNKTLLGLASHHVTVPPLAGVPYCFRGVHRKRRESKRRTHLDGLHTQPMQWPLNMLCL